MTFLNKKWRINAHNPRVQKYIASHGSVELRGKSSASRAKLSSFLLPAQQLNHKSKKK